MTLPLPSLDHVASARVRFRIDTDIYTTEDGWHIDDIVLRGFSTDDPSAIFADGFESGDTAAWSAANP